MSFSRSSQSKQHSVHVLSARTVNRELRSTEQLMHLEEAGTSTKFHSS
jgi:hypothetical protein